MAISPALSGFYWIKYEELDRLIDSLPHARETSFPIFEEKLSTEILRCSASFATMRMNQDTYRYWNTQAVIRLCNKYSFHAGEATENAMIRRLATQNFYTPIFEAPVVMQPQPVPVAIPQPQPIPPISQKLSTPVPVEAPGRKLFVVNFPSTWDTTVLTSVFSQYGEVTRCKMCGTFAFVTMRTCDDAFKARTSLNGARIEEGSTLTVTVANGNVSRNSKVFLQNIPLAWSDSDLQKQLAQFGEVIGCHLIHEKKYMNTKCAIVRFIDDQGARKAIASLNEAPISNPYMPNTYVKISAELAISDKRAMPPREAPAQQQAPPVKKVQKRMKEVLFEKKMLTLFETPMTLTNGQ